MSVSDTKKPSKTDWARVTAMTDDDIDTSDIPELDDDFFENATLRLPKNVPSIELDPDVKKYFPDSESVNQALRGLIKLIPVEDDSISSSTP